jgi:hypothetical protein
MREKMAEDPADGNGPCVRMAAALSYATKKFMPIHASTTARVADIFVT